MKNSFSFTTFLLIAILICVILSAGMFAIWKNPYLALVTAIPSVAFVWIYSYNAGAPNPDGTRNGPYTSNQFTVAVFSCFIVPILVMSILLLIS